MQNALLRLGSLTILVAIALIGMAQVMSVAIAFGNPSQRLGTELVPPFPHKHGMLPGGLGAQFAEGPPYPRGIGRHGRAGAKAGFALPNVDAGSIFQEAPTYNSGGYGAYSTTSADVNGDGKLDLLVANECASSSNCSNGSVGVLLGNGDGTFQAPVNYNSGGEDAVSIAAGDVNGDGKLDLLVGNQCANSDCVNGSVGVLLGNGDGTFQAPVNYNSGGEYAVSIAVEDVNGDGKLDLLVANFCADSSCSTNGTVSVLFGNGDGTFQAATSYNSGGYGADSAAVEDVNGDGKLDLLVANSCASSSNCSNGDVGVLLGNGDGTFQAATSYNSGGYGADSAAVADVNGDGKLDLLVGNECASNICPNGGVGVLLGNGDGTFQAPVSYASGGSGVVSIAVADVNGDGKLDLLVANPCANSNCVNGSVGVLLGNGGGTFPAPAKYSSGGYQAYSIAVADVNGDGKLDLLVANQYPSNSDFSNGVVGVLLGNGDGTFQAAVSYNSGGSGALSIAVADVNGDGKLDLLVANECVRNICSNGVVGVLLGNGDGTFQAPVSYNSGGEYANSIAAADVNGDGKVDLLVGNSCASSSNCSNGDVGVLLGNGDGTFQSPASYNSGGEDAVSIAVGDVNGDGKLDLLVCSNGGVSVLLGNGDGTFQAPISYNSGGYQAVSIAVGDVNDDGKLDLLVGNECANSNCSNGGGIGVLLGNGDGTFQTAQTTLTPAILGGGQIAVADFNGDGKLDAAIGSGAVLLLGKGDGTFKTPLVLTAAGLATAVGDFNGDGKPDLAVGGVTVLLNISVPAHPQTITFTTNAPASATYNSQFTVAATASSGLPVAFTSSGACTNLGATYTMTSGTGSCSVIANQTGNGSYSAAPQVTETVSAVPLSQTITFTTPPPATAKSGDTFTVAATGGASGNPVRFSVGPASVCINSGMNGATYTMTSNTGTCYVVANQAGNNNYAAATQVTEPVTAVRMVIKMAPTVSFSGAPASSAYLSTFTVATNENSGITPKITSTTAGVCTVSGATVTMKKGTGTCMVKASWASDAYYLAASLTQSTTATTLGTTTIITYIIPQPSHPLKVEVYFTVTNGANAVTGSVTVNASSGEHCTGTVTVGKCLLTFAAPGAKTLTATYAGNVDDSTSTSASFPLTVN